MNTFSAIRIEGGILGPDILEQLLGEDLPGQQPKDFGIEGRRSLTEEVARIFTDARSQWEIFQRRLNTLPESDLATSLTRDAWLIPFLSMLGYELDFNHRAYLVEGETFAISHRAGKHPDAPPVHCVGARQELGRLAPSGRPRLSPHGLLQEFLNRTEHLWGLVTNGRILRCLRDSTFVRRQAYIEFDLEQIFEQQLFTDFTILYRLLHRTRLPRSAEDAHDCLLEQYHAASLLQGGRVRDRLRDGVEECIKRLANGFLAHPDNGKLRAQMANSEWQIEDQTETPLAIRHSLFAQDFYRQLLRLVYRFLFLLVSEDRGLISDDPNYRSWYSISRLRHLCERRSAYTDHDDLWCSLRVLWNVLADERLAPMLGTAPLNGELFAELTLDNCTITNADLLGALWHLVFYRESPTQPLRRVNYAALDVEELGSVYESLLEYHPVIVASDEQRAASGEWRVGGGWRFDLVYGSERKSTGSYYTPPELVAELIRSALEPVIEERLEHAERAASSEWRTVKETLVQLFGENHAHTFVSRLGSLAESNGAGRRSLSHHERLSEGGTLRTDQPDAPSSNIGPGEHRRGMGAAGDEGISAIPEHRLRQPAGAGNLPDAGSTDQPDNTSAGRATAGLGAYVGQTTHRTPAQPLSEEQIAHLWNSLPLANRRSLLAEQCLLSIRVLDPACGSGHFLLAAARRLGKELARIRTGEDEPSPERTREAIRDVVAHCIYGVDKNPLAVELCRVALWLEAHSPGKPLTFLDHRIRCGDSLVGVLDLGELERGIPDEAFAPASTDAKDTASLLKKRNRTERRDLERGQLVFSFDSRSAVSELARQHAELDAIPDDTPAHVKEKQRRYDTARHSPLAIRQLQACNLWTAAFFQPLASSKQRAVEGRAGSGEQRAVEDTTDELLTARQSPLAESERLAARQSPLAKSSPLAFITTDTLRRYLESGSAHPQALAIAEALAVHNRFFHWPLEFPEVFLPSPTGRGAGGEGLLPSPTGRGAGGEGNPPQPKRPLPDDLLHFARQLRRNLTDAEKLLWMLLRGRQFGGWKFRRQHPMPPYVLDFYCHELRLAIELDGGQHNTPEQLHYDQQRSEYLAAKGINVLRFWNNQVLQETESVLQAIWNEALQRQQQLGQQPESLTLTLSPRERESSSPLPPGEGPGVRESSFLTPQHCGFDVVLGNPPFMGGLKISGAYGDKYRHWLEFAYAPYGGTADLCAAFYRRAYSLLKPGGRMGMVATNTIGQGDTRESGLAVILQQGGAITFARRFIKWPGAANVEVNLVAIHKPSPRPLGTSLLAGEKQSEREQASLTLTLSQGEREICSPRPLRSPLPVGEGMGVRVLDGQAVPFISSRLDAEPEAEPKRLPQNEGKAFIGDTVVGIGFVLGPDEAEALLAKDPRNADCLFPYLNGEDLNSHPEQKPSRWVICFHDWPLERAQQYPDLLRIVEDRVKPQRLALPLHNNTNRKRRDYWWQFGVFAQNMRRAIAPLRRVLVRSRVSELHAVVFVPKGYVYGDATVVFAFDDDYHFALLQSSVHEVWLRKQASSLRTDVRYTPTDCFDTFPFPPLEYERAASGERRAEEMPEEFQRAARVGGEYHEHRRQIMLARNLGLTKTYNLFHDPACTDDDIVRLRELHAEMDRAILACYGWDDVDLRHDFYPNDRGQMRFTVAPEARRELLRRLVEVNYTLLSGWNG